MNLNIKKSLPSVVKLVNHTLTTTIPLAVCSRFSDMLYPINDKVELVILKLTNFLSDK